MIVVWDKTHSDPGLSGGLGTNVNAPGELIPLFRHFPPPGHLEWFIPTSTSSTTYHDYLRHRHHQQQQDNQHLRILHITKSS